MYTSYIGKKFLKLYNERNKTELSPKEFFDSVIFPVFWNSDRVFLDVHNSSFAKQNKIPKGDVDTNPGKSDFLLRKERFYKEVSKGVPHSGILVGYAAKDILGVSSGQSPSNHSIYDEDEIFCSWIGVGLGVGIEDRLVFLVNQDEILWRIYEGWKYYRKYLEQTPNIKDKEIEFWNAWWLINYLSSNFDSSNPFDSLNIEQSSSMGETRIRKKNWSEVLLPISKKFNVEEKLTLYVYKLDKANTTLGFINVYLKEVNEIYEWRDHVFINKSDSILSDRQIEQLETHYKFKNACAMGTIGLRALEPAKLREFMPKGSVPFARGKDYKFNDEESYFNYKLFKIWIYAMLNKKEIIQLADQLALILLKYENAQKEENRGKTSKSSDVKNVIESKFFKEFVENIKPLINKENNKGLEEIVQKSYLEIASDNFPLFLTLVRFQYQIQKTNS